VLVSRPVLPPAEKLRLFPIEFPKRAAQSIRPANDSNAVI